MPLVGFKHSDESRVKMSQSHTGKVFSESHKKNHLKAIRKSSKKAAYRLKMSRLKAGVASESKVVCLECKKEYNIKYETGDLIL